MTDVNDPLGLGTAITEAALIAPSVPDSELRNKDGLSGWQMLAAARRELRKFMPYLDSAVLMLAPVEQPGLGTVAVTDTMILLVDLKYVLQQSVPALAGDLAHEVAHVLRDTHGRTTRLGCCTEEHYKISNIAADCAINPDIEAVGLPMISAPVPGIHAKQFGLPDGLLHEEYYWALTEMAQAGKLGGKGETPSCGRGWCGSGGGHAAPDEPSQDDPAGRDPSQTNNGNGGFPGRTPSEIDRARRHVAEAIAKSSSMGRGSIPGGWQRWADDLLEPPKIPWQQKLARIARQAVRYRMGACDLKYNDVSRRQAGVGYGVGKPIMPKFKAPVPSVGIMVDTSGSMGDSDFNAMMPEIQGILRAVGADVWFAACDADVHAFKPIRHWEEAKNLLIGGGGTDFRPFFARLATMKNGPTVVIVCTDGDATVPEEPPVGVSVIWLLTRAGARTPCGWGEALNVVED